MSSTNSQQVLDQVVGIVEKVTKIPKSKLDVDADFGSIGMDSILAMELMTGLAEQFTVSITPADFTDIDSVRELAEFLDSQSASDDVQTTAVKSEIPVAPARPVQSSATPAPTSHSHTADPAIQETRASRSRSQRRRRSPANSNSVDRLIQRIVDKYDIDLRNLGLNSVDEAVAYLVTNYREKLFEHYGFPQAEPTASINKTEVHEKPEQYSKLASNNVAIIGLSCRFPDAPDASEFWKNLLEKKVSIQEIPKSRWDTDLYYSKDLKADKTLSKWGALIDDIDCFDYSFFGLSVNEARVVDPQERLLLQEMYHAFQDAALNVKGLAGSKTGVFIGYEYNEYEHHLRSISNADLGIPPFNSSSQAYYLANRLSFLFDLRGPSESINVNCASSAVALNRAYLSLITNESDIAAVGSACLHLFAEDYIAGSQYGMLSDSGSCAVFDDQANGFTRGEGGAVVVLKRLEDAIQDNDRIYSVIKSCSQINRGFANDISEIKHESITQVLSECYQRSGIDVKSVDHIEVDGYATKWGDSFEFEGIKNAFEAGSHETEKHCSLGSVKGNIGHLEPASGLASVVKMALAMHHQCIPATQGVSSINRFMDVKDNRHPLFVLDEHRPFSQMTHKADEPVRMGINSFADSGVNIHILLEEFKHNSLKEPTADSGKELFILSAYDRPALERYINSYSKFLREECKDDSVDFQRLIYTQQTGREEMPERLAIVAESAEDLLSKLEYVLKQSLDAKSLNSQGVFYASLDEDSGSATVNDIVSDNLGETQLLQSTETGEWQSVALLWIKGFTIPWQTAWLESSIQPISLPLYPFAKHRCWVEVEAKTSPIAAVHSTNTIAMPVEVKAIVDDAKSEDQQNLSFSEYWRFEHDENTTDKSDFDGAEKVACFMKQVIARELKISIERISVTDDFLSVGLSSIGIAELVQQINDLLNEFLSPSLLFKYYTIESLAGFLAETYSEKLKHVIVDSLVKEAEQHAVWSTDSSSNIEQKKGEGSVLQQQKIIDRVLLQDDSNVENLEKVSF